MKIDMKLHSFFDTEKVTRAVKDSVRKPLSIIGSFIRRSARSKMRRKVTKRRKVSLPGDAPLNHTGLLRRGVLFAYDHTNQSVIVGPQKLNTKSNAPEVLEFGGRSRVNGRIVTIKARPYMGPAYEENKTKIPELFANSVRS